MKLIFQLETYLNISSNLPLNSSKSFSVKSIPFLIILFQTMKTNLYRFFSYLDADILRQSERMEWAAFLHNICYLHGAIKLRTRFGKAGWNVPEAFHHLGVPELTVSFTGGMKTEYNCKLCLFIGILLLRSVLLMLYVLILHTAVIHQTIHC
jgi:hypothetical protein